MQMERPDGPYAEEMTAPPAWLDVNENTLDNCATAFEADEKEIAQQLGAFKDYRTKLFSGGHWSGDAADAAQRDHDQRVADLESQRKSSAVSAQVYSHATAVVVRAKRQIIANVEYTQKLIAEVESNSQATGEQKTAFIRALVKETHQENVGVVAAAAAELEKFQYREPTIRAADWATARPGAAILRWRRPSRHRCPRPTPTPTTSNAGGIR
jgi:hypothetical protein